VIEIINDQKITMEMTLRKGLVLDITKEKANKTFMASKHNFKAHFGIIACSIKIVINCRFICYEDENSII